MANNLSRDELAHLLGASQSSDILATASRPEAKPSRSSTVTTTRSHNQEDVSAMDSKQAAALVAKQFAGKHKEGVQRYRAQKKMAYHLLPEEEGGMRDEEAKEDKEDGYVVEEEDAFAPARKRKKVEAQVIQRKRRDDSSSSSASDESSSDESAPRRRRRRDSSSDSDDSADLRRRRARERSRLRGSRDEEKDAVKKSGKRADSSEEEEEPRRSKAEPEIVKRAEPQREQSVIHMSQVKPKKQDDSSSDSESSTSSSSSSSSASSSSEDEASQPISKPLFIPKTKRGTIAEAEAQQQKLEEVAQRKEAEKQKRTLQSRALVAEAVAEKTNVINTSIGDDDEFDGENIPDDTDATSSPEEKQKERDAWEVRELVRILAESDLLEEMERQRLETQKRRNMTDEEMYKEGYHRPVGEARRRKDDKSKYLQRFHHRGAFYMDEDTLEQAGEDDVRHRAAEYSRAATGEDKIDKSALPEVMQVKKFGFAGYSTKYKGLAKEDTTDKGLDFVPIRGKKGDRRR